MTPSIIKVIGITTTIQRYNKFFQGKYISIKGEKYWYKTRLAYCKGIWTSIVLTPQELLGTSIIMKETQN